MEMVQLLISVNKPIIWLSNHDSTSDRLRVSGKLGGLKISFSHPNVPERDVYIFFDPPYLITRIRNRLYDKQELKVYLSLIRSKDL